MKLLAGIATFGGAGDDLHHHFGLGVVVVVQRLEQLHALLLADAEPIPR